MWANVWATFVAQTGRTVIATIHQPSSDIFATLDQLILLCDGQTSHRRPRHPRAALLVSYRESLMKYQP